MILLPMLNHGPLVGRSGWLLTLWVVAISLSTGVASAAGVSKQMCVESHLNAQSQRMQGLLVESQRNLRTCANEDCPDIVRRDCVKWLEEIQEEVPTVIFEAFDQRGALKDVTVSHDGRTLAVSIDGAAIELNPGTYNLVFETADGRHQTRRVLIRQGDRNRSVAVEFPEDQKRESAWVLRVPLAARVSGGIALVAAGVAAGFGTSALIHQSDALDSCAPNCDERVRDQITARAAVADIAGGVALASAVVTVVLVSRASREQRVAAVGPILRVSPRAAVLGLRGVF